MPITSSLSYAVFMLQRATFDTQVITTGLAVSSPRHVHADHDRAACYVSLDDTGGFRLEDDGLTINDRVSDAREAEAVDFAAAHGLQCTIKAALPSLAEGSAQDAILYRIGVPGEELTLAVTGFLATVIEVGKRFSPASESSGPPSAILQTCD